MSKPQKDDYEVIRSPVKLKEVFRNHNFFHVIFANTHLHILQENRKKPWCYVVFTVSDIWSCPIKETNFMKMKTCNVMITYVIFPQWFSTFSLLRLLPFSTEKVAIFKIQTLLFSWFVIWDTIGAHTILRHHDISFHYLISQLIHWNVDSELHLNTDCISCACVCNNSNNITSNTDVTQWFHAKMCSVFTGLDFSDSIHFWTCDTIIMWHIRYDSIEIFTFDQSKLCGETTNI